MASEFDGLKFKCMNFYKHKDDHPCTNKNIQFIRRDDEQLLLPNLWEEMAHNAEKHNIQDVRNTENDSM